MKDKNKKNTLVSNFIITNDVAGPKLSANTKDGLKSTKAEKKVKTVKGPIKCTKDHHSKFDTRVVIFF